ncbi:hypothetical protein TrST_g944 [Triparma strigata]|uniref:Uncharacterized protein n=1 Tax=Triparma strigata TaxID=1606541 RepID=A0A9W7BF54_9STRA|nr:hypothetical protein TrST_g944 [Triparma strigata]
MITLRKKSHRPPKTPPKPPSKQPPPTYLQIDSDDGWNSSSSSLPPSPSLSPSVSSPLKSHSSTFNSLYSSVLRTRSSEINPSASTNDSKVNVRDGVSPSSTLESLRSKKQKKGLGNFFKGFLGKGGRKVAEGVKELDVEKVKEGFKGIGRTVSDWLEDSETEEEEEEKGGSVAGKGEGSASGSDVEYCTESESEGYLSEEGEEQLVDPCKERNLSDLSSSS